MRVYILHLFASCYLFVRVGGLNGILKSLGVSGTSMASRVLLVLLLKPLGALGTRASHSPQAASPSKLRATPDDCLSVGCQNDVSVRRAP